MNTPRTGEALAKILERDGELSEDNAPAVLVKLCRELERELHAALVRHEKNQLANKSLMNTKIN